MYINQGNSLLRLLAPVEVLGCSRFKVCYDRVNKFKECWFRARISSSRISRDIISSMQSATWKSQMVLEVS